MGVYTLRRVAVLCTTALLPTPAFSFDILALPAGYIARWKAENGDTQMTYIGRDRYGYRFDFQRDAAKRKPESGTFWTTKDGQTHCHENADGVDTYAPHDCQLTVGKCRYTETRADGDWRKMIRISSVKGGVWHYQIYQAQVSPEKLRFTGSFTVDTGGFEIDHDYYDQEDWKYWTRRTAP
jgi:hypothetical protein